jgi:type I restriction enzyme S subunit
MTTIPLKFVARVAYGLGQPPRAAADGVPVLRATNIYRGRFVCDGLMRVDPADVPWNRCPPLVPGEILVVRSGAYTGDSAIVTEEWRGAAPGYDLRITPLGVDPRYLAYALLSSAALEYFDDCRTRAAQPHLNADQVANLRVPTLDRVAQRKVADFLDGETARIDALMALRSQQARLLDERASVMRDRAIEGPRARSADAAGGWPMVAISRAVVEMCDGPFGSLLTSAHYRPDGPRVVRLGNIGQARFLGDDEARISTAHFEGLRRHEVKPGDLLVAGLGDENNPLGRACVAPDGLGPTIAKADCFRFRLKPTVFDHGYVACVLSSRLGMHAAREVARGSTRSRANLGGIASIRIPCPPVQAQREIVAVIEDAGVRTRAAMTAIDRQIALLRERRQALITAAVTGKVEMPPSSVREAAA